MKNVDDKNNKNKASNNTKKYNNKKVQNSNKKPDAKVVKPVKNVQDEGVRVKEIKVTTVDDFYEEDDDKKLIVIIAIAILIIMATIVGLLVGCEKKEEEEPKKPVDDVVIPVDDDTTDKEDKKEEKETVKKVTVKTESKEDEVVEPKTKYYSVKFLLENETFKYLEVEENSLVSPFVPKGYTTCEYFTTGDFDKEFNFKNRVNDDTVIYTVCKVDKYTIEYDVETDNPSEYNAELGSIALLDAVSLETQLPFLGWYLDPDYTTEEVTELSVDLLKYADENKIIRLYARFDLLEITYLDNEGVELGKDNYWPLQTTVRENSNFTTSVCGNDKLLGWTSTKESKVINYKPLEKFNELRDHLDLYPVCGTATVIYTSEDASVSMGYTNEDLADYDLPQPSDVELDTPTYVIPVEEETETSKKVVPDEAIEILENEIKLQDAIDKAGINYTPEVGDNVEEHNKVFVGWVEKEELPPVEEESTSTLEDPTLVESESQLNKDEIVGEENVIPEIEVLPEDYVPTKENTELEAIWREQTEEELESGIYDIVEEDVLEEETEDSQQEIEENEEVEESTDIQEPIEM